jgi:DNA-binding transcriptional LysR family regulator
MERLARQAPQVRLHFQHADTGAFKLLDARRVDLALAASGTLSRFETTPLYCDTWTALVCRDNREVINLTVEQLFSLPHATYSLGAEGHTIVEHLLGQHARPVKVGLTVDNIMYLPRLLRGTPLVAIVPSRIADRALRNTGTLREVPLPITMLPPVEIAMGWHSASTHDAGHRWFRELVADAAKSLAPLPTR